MFELTKEKLNEEFGGDINLGLRDKILSRLESYSEGVCPIPHASNLVNVLFDGIGLTALGEIKKKTVLEVFGAELKKLGAI